MCLPNLEDKEKACQAWWSHTEYNDPEVSLQIRTMRGSAVLIQSESLLHFFVKYCPSNQPVKSNSFHTAAALKARSMSVELDKSSCKS